MQSIKQLTFALLGVTSAFSLAMAQDSNGSSNVDPADLAFACSGTIGRLAIDFKHELRRAKDDGQQGAEHLVNFSVRATKDDTSVFTPEVIERSTLGQRVDVSFSPKALNEVDDQGYALFIEGRRILRSLKDYRTMDGDQVSAPGINISLQIPLDESNDHYSKLFLTGTLQLDLSKLSETREVGVVEHKGTLGARLYGLSDDDKSATDIGHFGVYELADGDPWGVRALTRGRIELACTVRYLSPN